MFTASRLMLAVGVVLAGELTTAAGGDDSTPNPVAIPLIRDNDRHRQLLKLVARGGGDIAFLRVAALGHRDPQTGRDRR